MVGISDLPAELRVLIWGFCLPGPRNVVVGKGRHTPAPAVLHLCSESRAEARKKSHELAFPTAGSDGRLNGEPVVWFDFSQDTLCLESRTIEPGSYLENFRRVRSLGFSYWDLDNNSCMITEIIDYTTYKNYSLTALKETVLFGPPINGSGGYISISPANSDKEQVTEWDMYVAFRHMLTDLHRPQIPHLFKCWPPPMRWQPSYSADDPFGNLTGASKTKNAHLYTYRCAAAEDFDIHRLTKDQLGWFEGATSGGSESELDRGFEGCPVNHDVNLNEETSAQHA